ncbi:hypothetical protein LTR10_013471 [Elasticomyces elasticus]|uniref:Ketoreductase (KR) domain-containing protein n=1 Tax=Exophiala sideris TaxID=1016849 RepID=A0ABR0JPS0_9EURO|nr:hypothetical protein LTR10_013471 [Elasticomyces elasticus]KAK5039606.1 hypothetical protein LTS07_000100 [Exophiala sideris]KAK5041158.1 hypothetical protein LTR13_002632 [Exophiala sideris]KAK5067983.1 hypothetical protein LTR69_000100 [Exophiala sideris]KAK5187285.1 hypothetical protein LTR44_000100 [Eurotiomycetes sp. CCFEE 6388]
MKVALVTASSAGLGATIAKHLVQHMRVVINYSSTPDRANVVLAELSSLIQYHGGGDETSQGADGTNSPPRSHAIRADLSQRSEIQRLVSETVAVMGRLDVVVSNGGWTKIRKFSDLDDNVEEDDWDRCFNINVKSHLYLFHAAKEHLSATDGSFVTTASVAGVKPSGSSLPYAVTKAAQIYLVKCLASISGPRIRVNSVSPGILMTVRISSAQQRSAATELTIRNLQDWGRQFPEDHLNKAKDATILKRFASLDDVAQQVVILATSTSMTGVNVVIDSGFSIL